MPKIRSLSPSTSPCLTPPAESQVLEGITIHVIAAKLDPKEVGEMFSLAQNIGAKLSRIPQNASVLITALTMKQRLKRHISWDVANTKHIVSPQWLRACAERNRLLPFSEYQTIKTAASDRRTSPAQSRVSATQSAASPTAQSSRSKGADFVNYDHSLSTHRHSPLVCPNQDLCLELAILVKSRFLEGKVNSELSYSRAIAVLKAYPKVITDANEIRKLPYIGPKIQELIKEYLKNGHINEAQQTAASERYKVLSQLTQVHGVGPAKAREHYEAGRKTIADLVKFYESKSKGGTYSGVLTALRLQDELSSPIPRVEVEAIAKSVYDELITIQPGCEYTICGGYRRGKPHSSDIDIIFTHKEPGLERHLCTRLVDCLRDMGVVTAILRALTMVDITQAGKQLKPPLEQSSYTSNHEGIHGRQKETRACMDVLDKALAILKFPDSVHRRVDLIFAPYSVYWTAIVGWTGSKQFERDLRIHAKKQGLKFDSGGITRQRDSKPIVAYSEEEVFAALGLEYIQPELRNADV